MHLSRALDGIVEVTDFGNARGRSSTCGRVAQNACDVSLRRRAAEEWRSPRSQSSAVSDPRVDRVF